MRRPFISGNWKMNLDKESIRALCEALGALAPSCTDRSIGVFPPYPYIGMVHGLLRESSVAVGGQDLHFEKKGAYTGAVSGAMLKDVGATHVLIGHSERRHVFNDTNEDTRKKIIAALEAGLVPVLCIGEKLEEREVERTADVVVGQLKEGLEGLTEEDIKDLVIAYEPVWAIGTGVTATPQQAGEAHALIRSWFSEAYSKSCADDLRILYGGSVTPDNVDSLMAVPDVDGTLVGGASLKPDSFSRIVRFNQ